MNSNDRVVYKKLVDNLESKLSDMRKSREFEDTYTLLAEAMSAIRRASTHLSPDEYHLLNDHIRKSTKMDNPYDYPLSWVRHIIEWIKKQTKGNAVSAEKLDRIVAMCKTSVHMQGSNSGTSNVVARATIGEIVSTQNSQLCQIAESHGLIERTGELYKPVRGRHIQFFDLKVRGLLRDLKGLQEELETIPF
jgi:hypothetical protein